MNYGEQRRRFRAVLSGSKCLTPADVFDPLSARIAEAVGYEIGILAGSVASNTTLAAPDLIGLTLTELADQVRRIMRVSKLSLLVDADHGYGNALNVMRTVQELEHAGVSALSIHDTALPVRFAQPEGVEELISTEEMVGKLCAAVEARQDPSLVIAARTAALKVEGTDRAVTRAKAYAVNGIDAIFITWLETLDQIQAIHESVNLPIIVGPAPRSTDFAYGGKAFHEFSDPAIIVGPALAPLKREALAARGARIVLQGHQPLLAAVKALQETYTHLYNGGAPAELKSRIASPQEIARLVNRDAYRNWQREYLRSEVRTQ